MHTLGSISCVVCLAAVANDPWLPSHTQSVSVAQYNQAPAVTLPELSPIGPTQTLRQSETDRYSSGQTVRLKPAWWPKVLQREIDSPDQRLGSAESGRTRPRKWLPRFRKRDVGPSDSLLITRCRELLGRDVQLAGSGISVGADQGIIFLRGSVVSHSLHQRAEMIASHTAGASGVRNELAVKPPPRHWSGYSVVTLGAPVAVGRTSVQPATSQAVSNPVVLDSRPGGPRVRTYVVQRPRPDSAFEGFSPGVDHPSTLVASSTPNVRSWTITRSHPVGVIATVKRSDYAPAAVDCRNATPISGEGFQTAANFYVPPVPSLNAVTPAPDIKAPEIKEGSFPTLATDSVARPAVMNASSMTRANIDAVLRDDHRAQGLTYQFNDGELVLTGSVHSPGDLHAITAELDKIPGIDLLGWQNVQYVQ